MKLAKPKFKTRMKSKGRARGPTNVGGDKGNKLVSERNYTEIGECNDPFPAPERAAIKCPDQCPLMRFDPEMLCHWRCISEDRCKTFPGVIDRAYGYCYVCAVAGCKQCKSDEQYCLKCHEGFRLENGECFAESMLIWNVLFGVLGFIGVIVLVYVVHLAWRPVVSEGALLWGMENRSKSKNRRDDGNHELYGLNESLADTVTSAGGIGATLHFSWQRMTLWWCVGVTVTAMAVTAYHGRFAPEDALQMMPYHDETEGICSERLDVQSNAEFEAMRVGILWLTGLVYVGSSLGAVFWSWWQRKKYQAHDDETTDMTDYALMCRGFPVELEGERPGKPDAKLEEEYMKFFQETWGASVVGVSIAWNVNELDEEIKVVVSDMVHDLERDYKSQTKDTAEPNWPGTPASYISTPTGDASSRPASRTGCLFGPLVEAVDGVLWGEVPACCQSQEDELASPRAPDSRAEAQRLLDKIPTTGTCFVVFRTEKDMRESLDVPLPKFRGEHDIKVENTEGNAEVVLWDGFTTSEAERRWLMFVGFWQMMAVIALWTTLFWGPYTIYIVMWNRTAGASQGDATVGLVIGLLITVGNQVVYAAAGIFSEKAKYTCRDFRDTYYTGLYTFAVLVNTVLDMWLVTIMARGWQRDASNDPSALVRNPSMQHALFTQLLLYLWPGTLLLPFMAEPLVLNVGPYFVAKWLVRSKPDCSKQQAEECLVLPPFDLNRYGDNLINIIMVCLFYFLTAVTLWWIFLMLSISLLVIYAWDCYRFKRGTCRTHFATQDMDILSHYMMAFPCAILAGGFVFKVAGGQGMVADWDPDGFLKDHPEIWLKVGVAFFGHLLAHCLLLKYVVPRCVPKSSREDTAMDEIPYEVTASRICCNWFNANPVHCIRSLYLYGHKPAHVFYRPGREYLHKKNKRERDRGAMIIYEAQEFTEEEGFLQDFKQGGVQAFTEARSQVEQTAQHMSRTLSQLRTSSQVQADYGEGSGRLPTVPDSGADSSRRGEGP